MVETRGACSYRLHVGAQQLKSAVSFDTLFHFMESFTEALATCTLGAADQDFTQTVNWLMANDHAAEFYPKRL